MFQFSSKDIFVIVDEKDTDTSTHTHTYLYICALINGFQHAHALEVLSKHLKEGSRVLDVGSGSGYLTSCMAIMVNRKSSIYIYYV